jgi:hypothetical protein
MVNSTKRLVRRQQAEAAFIDLTFQQLSRIFPFVYKHQEMKTEDIPSLLVDIIARSTNGQLILFEVKYFPPNTTLDYAVYPSIAALKDSVKNFALEVPPIVAVIANNSANEAIRNIFVSSEIPLITLAANTDETKARLQAAFQEFAVTLPEFAPDAKTKIMRAEREPRDDQPAAQKLKHKVLAYIDRLNLNVAIVINILLTLGLGIILGVNEKLLLAELVALVGIVVVGVIIYLKEMIKSQACLNPNLIVLRDESKLVVKRDVWFCEQHLLFKARRKKVDEYLFKVEWTGSSPKVKITCRDEDGIVAKKNVVISRAMPWNLWGLKFDRPLPKGQMRGVVLKYILPDPEHKASPYLFFSFNNVWKCKEFQYRLALADDLKAKAVYFVQGAAPAMMLKKVKIPRNLNSNEYVIHEQPDSESKYSLEWELKNGANGTTDENNGFN